MGLINWLKDRVILNLEHDIALMKADLESTKLQLETLRNKVQGIMSQRGRRRAEQENEEEGSNYDMEAIKEAFGGSYPIELLEKYKRDNSIE